MGARTDNSSEPTRLKRHLAVIEELQDEEHTADDSSNGATAAAATAAGAAGARTDCSRNVHGADSDSHHLRCATVDAITAVAKRTRRKAVYGAHSPILSTCLLLRPSPKESSVDHNCSQSTLVEEEEGGKEEEEDKVVIRSVQEYRDLHNGAGIRAEEIEPLSEAGLGCDDRTRIEDNAGEEEVWSRRNKHSDDHEGSTPPRVEETEVSGATTQVAGGGEARRVNSFNGGEATHSTDCRVLRECTSDPGDLTRLKDTATRLKLKTRRQSYLTWRAEYVDRPARDSRSEVKVKDDSGPEGRLTSERKERIDTNLKWIKGQLVDLRRQDQSLARQLLGIRHELSSLRLQASCEEHRELLDDAEEHVQELKELSRFFVDFPTDLLPSPSSLRHVGVTRMNLSSRRFSAC